MSQVLMLKIFFTKYFLIRSKILPGNLTRALNGSNGSPANQRGRAIPESRVRSRRRTVQRELLSKFYYKIAKSKIAIFRNIVQTAISSSIFRNVKKL